MNTSETLQKMKELRLYGMYETYDNYLKSLNSSELTLDELIGLLIDTETTYRENRKTERLLKNAKFRYNATMEEIDYSASRQLDKSQLLRLYSCDYIKQGENIIITGATGSGKSYIASALGNKACEKGYKVMYYNLLKLMEKMKILQADLRDVKEKERISRHDLLILDDFGLKELNTEERLLLLEILEDRHGIRSTVITSQLPVEKWYEMIGDSTIADAILDRLIHSSRRIEIKGESKRKKAK
ncbi:MAG: IS21-like element helper ATPase IstB [Bacteroidota bacterium]